MPDTLLLTGQYLCGFCRDRRHERCPHAIQNGVAKEAKARPRIWLCPCDRDGCGGKVLSCVTCKRVHNDVDPTERVCMDRDACQARINTIRANNPIYQQVKRIQEKHAMAKAENTTPREPAKPKTGTCKCGCDGATKGGNFLPGHDARLVSKTVESVITKSATEAQGRKVMAPFSDALKAKFEKSLGLAQEKAAKQKAAAAEKAEAAKVKAAEAKSKGNKPAASATEAPADVAPATATA